MNAVAFIMDFMIATYSSTIYDRGSSIYERVSRYDKSNGCNTLGSACHELSNRQLRPDFLDR